MILALRIFGRWLSFETGKAGDERDPVEDHDHYEEEEKPKQVRLGFGNND